MFLPSTVTNVPQDIDAATTSDLEEPHSSTTVILEPALPEEKSAAEMLLNISSLPHRNTRKCDEENADNFSLHSSSSEASLSTLLRKEVEERQEEEEEAFKPVTKKQIGDLAIVKFCTKKSVKYFVGNILSFNDYGEAVVSFIRKASDRTGITTFHFPSQEDITDVMEDDIIYILPKPTIGRRGEVLFLVGAFILLCCHLFVF
ncbi:unnamed protein product [Psylliodes chrysocephalus]|uniref:Uncharacterized protein n=1 Tax=Psylliodes chrysocephalus TaxID=3402493 RepID=A0A9P0GIK7_9CUCU|nr:unnamed protein product [Psylliodes chrysocephala]